MKKTSLALVLGSVINTLPAFAAETVALELYEDSSTHQIFTAPGPGRVKLGRFIPAPEAAPATTATAEPKAEAKPEVQPMQTAAATPAKPAEKKWYDKLALRGYTQIRLNEPLNQGGEDLSSPGDRFIGDNQSLGIRRARIVLSGDVSEHLSVYIQPDFASNAATPSGSSYASNTSQGHFGQLRDAYADIFFDKAHEFRLRAGQSKMPYGWENLQSSQNRLTPDRADALNSGLRDERDLGLIFYYSPTEAQHRFRDLVRSGLKGSGDYGVFGFGFYNGQGANRPEQNDSFHAVAHVSYPFKFGSGQFFEVGVDAYRGYYKPYASSVNLGGGASVPALDGGLHGVKDQRVAGHVILYPQPFGLQAEWTVGKGPELDVATKTIRSKSLSGGYVQAMYKQDTRHFGSFIPYAKWQTYDGASKFDTNSPAMEVDEYEIGLEWQPFAALELTAAYANMERTKVGGVTANSITSYPTVKGELARLQLQFNY